MENNQYANPTTLENNQKNPLHHPLVIILISAVVFTIFGYSVGTQVSKNQGRDKAPTFFMNSEVVQTKPSEASLEATWQNHSIDSIGLTFSTPPEMEVTSSVDNNSQTGQPQTLTMYIQKNVAGADYYQLYGIYQWNSSTDSQALLEVYKEELNPESIKEITMSGLPALEGQIKGQRNRFVTYIAIDQGILSLYTADPTPANKEMTDQILATFQFKN